MFVHSGGRCTYLAAALGPCIGPECGRARAIWTPPSHAHSFNNNTDSTAVHSTRCSVPYLSLYTYK
jgi:hypothetical protein